MVRRAIPAVVLVPLLVVALVASSSACGTIANFASNEPPKPYGGVMADLEVATKFDPVDDPRHLVAAPFVMLDICLSAVLDTASLPIVVLKTMEAAWKHAAAEHYWGRGESGSTRPPASGPLLHPSK